MAEEQTAAQFMAAIDLGSNSFHMIIAELVDGELRVKDRLREMVRLAGGLDERGKLDAPSRQRALECLQRFGQRLTGFPPGSVRAVGTNTLRRARSEEFLEQAQQALGHPIEIIAGVEEARLIYLGVAHGLPHSDEIRLVADIGGGSTEVILGRHFEPLEKDSLYMGCVSFSRRFFSDGKISVKRMRKAVIAARQEVQGVEREYRDIGWGQAVGASGTIKAVRDVVRSNGWSDEGITLASLRRLADELVAKGHVDKLGEINGLKEERIPVICGGVAVLLALFEGLQVERMFVSDQALREGLLYDMLGRLRHEDVRERTIGLLSERYQIDTAQAARVEQSALQALAQLAQPWSLGDEPSRLLLHWAARLHEVGLAIAHGQYHKHGAYLLANSDLPGFTRREQQQLAMLVQAHRRKFPLGDFQPLGKDAPRCVRLSVLLRLAVLLHRSHSDEPLPPIELTAREQGLKIGFPEGWLEQHPLTLADLEQEVGFLRGAKFVLEFS